MGFVVVAGLLVVGFILFAATRGVREVYRRLKRAEYIRTAPWPPGLFERVQRRYPQLSRKDMALIGNGLRQFFLAYLNGGRRYVAMPSEAADQLWHEFILYTREYQKFCDTAFGRFLHHTPAMVLSPQHKQSNEGLRRVWWQCCREEGINPSNPSRLPLLFALDAKFRIPNGFYYHPNCEQLRRQGVAGAQCGGDFSSSSVDGGTDGFGGSGSGASGDGGGDSGGDSSCGGGCGGGD